MRDKLKDTNYFEKRIRILNEVIEAAKERLETGEIIERRIPNYKFFNIFGRSYQKLFVFYSIGKGIKEFENELVELVRLIPEFWEPNVGKAKVRREGVLDDYLLEHYQMALQLMALGVLFRNDFVLSKLKELIDRDKIRDELFDFFLSKGDLEEVKPPYLFDEKMSKIKNVHENLRLTLFNKNKDEQILLIEKYLNKEFYEENGPAYESHKKKHVSYNGYWSFESGALAVLLDVDTTSLRKSDYFPADLVDNYRQL